MLRPIVLAAAALAAAAFFMPQAAGAAIQLGAVATVAPPATCGASAYTVFGGGEAFTVPSGNWAFTSLRTAAAGAAGTEFSFRLVRPAGVQFVSTAALPATVGVDGTASVAVHLRATPGEMIGLSKPAGGLLNCANANAGALMPGLPGTEIGTDAVFTPTVIASYVPNVAATLERDIDGDSYGDETQDLCPTDPIRSADPCFADLSATFVTPDSRDRLSAQTGSGVALSVVVENASTSPAQGARVSFSAGRRLAISYASPSQGTCELEPAASCDVGTIPGKGRVTVVVLVRGLLAGKSAIEARASAITADPVGADNTATVQADVSPARHLTGCTVPDVRALRVAVARRLLAGTGCRLGRAKRPRRARGTLVVVRQSARPGSHFTLDRRVDVTLGRARR